MIMNNNAAFDQLECLLGKLCKDSISSTLPSGLKEILQDFTKDFVTKIEAYWRNYEPIMSLTIPEQANLDVSDPMKKVSQSVKDRHVLLQAIMDVIAGFNKQETLLERQMAEIEKKPADVRQQRNLKHIQRAQVEDDLDKHTASLRGTKEN